MDILSKCVQSSDLQSSSPIIGSLGMHGWLPRFMAQPEARPRAAEVELSIGEELKRQRELLERERHQVCRGAQVEPSMLWRIETGHIAKPAFDVIERIAEYLGIDPVPLLTKAGYPIPARMLDGRGSDEAPPLRLGNCRLTPKEYAMLRKVLDASRGL